MGKLNFKSDNDGFSVWGTAKAERIGGYDFDSSWNPKNCEGDELKQFIEFMNGKRKYICVEGCGGSYFIMKNRGVDTSMEYEVMSGDDLDDHYPDGLQETISCIAKTEKVVVELTKTFG